MALCGPPMFASGRYKRHSAYTLALRPQGVRRTHLGIGRRDCYRQTSSFIGVRPGQSPGPLRGGDESFVIAGHFNSASEPPALANRPGALQVSLGISMPLADDFAHPDAGVATLSSHRASLGVASHLLTGPLLASQTDPAPPARHSRHSAPSHCLFHQRTPSAPPQRRYAYTSAIRPRSVTRSHLQALSCSASGSYSANAPHSPLCSEPLLRR